MSRKNGRGAFSLIELLVCIAVIAIVIGILVPVVQTVRSRSATIRCMSNLREIGRLATLWSSDNRGFIVPLYINGDANTLWVHRLLSYTGTGQTYQMLTATPIKPSIFVCPATPHRLGYGHNYNYLGWGLTADSTFMIRYTQVQKPAQTVFMTDVINNAVNPPIWSPSVRAARLVYYGMKDHMVDFKHPGKLANILWVDGHVSSEPERPLLDCPPPANGVDLWNIQ